VHLSKRITFLHGSHGQVLSRAGILSAGAVGREHREHQAQMHISYHSGGDDRCGDQVSWEVGVQHEAEQGHEHHYCAKAVFRFNDDTGYGAGNRVTRPCGDLGGAAATCAPFHEQRHRAHTGGDFEAQSSGRNGTGGEGQTLPWSFLDRKNWGDDSGQHCNGHHPRGGGRSLVQGEVRLSQGVVFGDGGEGDRRNAGRENITVYSSLAGVVIIVCLLYVTTYLHQMSSADCTKTTKIRTFQNFKKSI
jgi:hypothetical protein